MDDWGKEELRYLTSLHCSLNPETSSPSSRNATETCLIEIASLYKKQTMTLILKKKVCAKLLTERKFFVIRQERITLYFNSIRKSNKPWDKYWEMEMCWYLEHLNIIYSLPPSPRPLLNSAQGEITVYYREALGCHKRYWRWDIRM